MKIKKLNTIVAKANKVLAESFDSTGDLLDSTKFLSDVLHGLQARLDVKVAFSKVDEEHDYVCYIAKGSPEAYLSTEDFKGLIELEKYLATKYWSGKGKHLSITVWPINKASFRIEVSVAID